MATEQDNLKIEYNVKGDVLIVGFSGWMDGGEVSTGTVDYLVRQMNARKFASIKPDGFYIYNFPGSMEFSALFRPHTRIEEGVIKKFKEPENIFYCSEPEGLLLFSGKEPSMRWHEYTDCFFEMCLRCEVKRILFVGSVSGLTPHTREPRFLCSVSDSSLKEGLQKHGTKYADYSGPSSIITYLTLCAAEKGIEMISLVAEIPAYVQGYNPRCIEATVRHLGLLSGVHMEVDDIRMAGDEFEKRLDEIIQEQPELAEKIVELEADYDEQVFDNEMGDLKLWLQQKGIRVD